MTVAYNITNLTDARYFAAKDVEYLVFNLEAGTPGFVDPITVKAMEEWVVGPTIVGAFRHSSLETVLESVKFYGLKGVQVWWSEGNEKALKELIQLVDVILVFDVNGQSPDELYDLQDEYLSAIFMLNFGDQDLKSMFTDEWRSFFNNVRPVIQSNASVEDLKAAIVQFRLADWAVSGGDEEKVGLKSFDDLDEILDWVEEIGRPQAEKERESREMHERANNNNNTYHGYDPFIL